MSRQNDDKRSIDRPNCGYADWQLVSDISHSSDHVHGHLQSKPPHVDVDHIGPGVEVVAPDLGEQLLPRADIVAMTDEVRKQEKLSTRKRNDAVVDLGFPPAQVEGDNPVAQHGPCVDVPGGVLYPAANACQELAQGERLGEEVDRSLLETLHSCLYVTYRGENHHALVRLLRLHGGQDSLAVETRHCQIQYDEVARILRGQS